MNSHEHERFRLSRTELIAIVAFWTFMALLSTANQLLDPRRGMLQSALPAAPIAVAFAHAFVWAALTPVIFWMANRASRPTQEWIWRVLVFIALGVLIAMAVDTVNAAIRESIFEPPRFGRRGRRGPPPGGPFAGISRLWFLDDLTVFIAVFAVGFAREYFLRYQSRQAEAVRLTAQLADARLSALRKQLNPHFLFNTLNAVSALVERDPRAVRRMIARLSDLLRQSLEDRGNQVTLQEELTFVQHYLDIMQIRFPDTLRVTVDVESSLHDAVVPNLLLQPLVENAIKHGGIEQSGAARIDITVRRRGENIVLNVRDDGPGVGSSVATGGGTGLRNTRERLHALYGDNYQFELRPSTNGGTEAEVTIPYVTRSDR